MSAGLWQCEEGGWSGKCDLRKYARTPGIAEFLIELAAREQRRWKSLRSANKSRAARKHLR